MVRADSKIVGERREPLRAVRPDGRLRKHEAKIALLKMAGEGIGPSEGIRSLGFSVQTYEQWRREDPAWAEQMTTTLRLARLSRGEGINQALHRASQPDLDFPAFSQRYLKARVFPHMLNVIDLIEHREPRWLHPAMTYERGEPDLVIVNVPPEHGKTMTLSINYVTYRLAKEPNLRVLVASKSQQMADKMLLAVKERLTAPTFSLLQQDWAPRGGFAGNSLKWTQNTVYLNPTVRDSGEKDPSVQSLGLGSHIYGARADLIILDDVIDQANSQEFDKQIEWIQSQVLSRLSPTGTLLLVGTRLAPRDLYMEIQNEALYPESTSPWTYLAMPAVLDFAENPDDWLPLWPYSNLPDIGDRTTKPNADGLYEKWSGKRLHAKRARMTPNLWARVYQQAQVTEDTVFDPEALRGCVNGARPAGLIAVGKAGCRPDGMSGLVVVAGLDPATAGYTAMVVIGLDVRTKKRFVLDGFNKAACRPDEIRGAIYRLTEKYGVVEWVVETNGFQGFLAEDREINNFLAGRGAIVRPHHTGLNKADPNFGVSAMSGLLSGWREGHNLIEFPSTHGSEALKALLEQLSVWAPDLTLKERKKRKSDLVMALWMAELACQRRVDLASSYARHHQVNPFLTRWDRDQQASVDLSDFQTFDKLTGSGV